MAARRSSLGRILSELTLDLVKEADNLVETLSPFLIVSILIPLWFHLVWSISSILFIVVISIIVEMGLILTYTICRGSGSLVSAIQI